MKTVFHFGLIATIGVAAASTVRAQEKSWVGELVMNTKPHKQIQFGDVVDGKQTYFPFSGQLPIKVRDDREGWLRIHDGHREGWVDKADFVLVRDAPAFFHRRVQANPNDRWALYMRGMGWHDKGEPDNAIKDYNECIRLDPTDSATFIARGVAWNDKKDYDKAIADFNEAIRLDPEYALSYNNRGLAWMNKKDYDKAIADHNEAIRLDPKYVKPYLNRGLAWMNKKDYDQAITDFNEAIRLDPKYVKPYLSRGIAWSAKKDYDKAITDYNEVTRLDPKFVNVHYHRGIAWSAKKDYDKAIASFDETIRLEPKFLHAYSQRGKAECLSKKYDAALATWADALKIDANYSWAMMRTAHFLATCPDDNKRDGKKAIGLAKKAMALEKNLEPEFQEMLAAVFAEAGDFVEAVRWQEKALEDPLFKNDKDARRRLGLYRDKKPYRQE